MEVVDDGAGIETPIALRLPFDCAVQRGQARPCAPGDDDAVEVAIEIEDAAGALGGGPFDFAEFLVDGGEPRDRREAVFAWQSRGAPAGKAFEATDDGIQLIGVVAGERGDEHAGFADVVLDVHIAFALEPLQRAADGGSTHTEVPSEIAFDDPGAGGQFSVHDQFPDLLKCGPKSRSVLCFFDNGVDLLTEVEGLGMGSQPKNESWRQAAAGGTPTRVNQFLEMRTKGGTEVTQSNEGRKVERAASHDR